MYHLAQKKKIHSIKYWLNMTSIIESIYTNKITKIYTITFNFRHDWNNFQIVHNFCFVYDILNNNYFENIES